MEVELGKVNTDGLIAQTTYDDGTGEFGYNPHNGQTQTQVNVQVPNNVSLFAPGYGSNGNIDQNAQYGLSSNEGGQAHINVGGNVMGGSYNHNDLNAEGGLVFQGGNIVQGDGYNSQV